MSSMNNFMEAYRAVHNKESKEEFYAKRDLISEMNISTLFDTDLVDIAEQVVAKLFETHTVEESKTIVTEAFTKVSKIQEEKVSRLIEAFKLVFNKVDETAPTVAREAFARFLDMKRLERNKSVMNSVDESHARIHRHKNAAVIESVKSLLEKKMDAVGKEDADIDNDGDVDSSDKYLHKRRKAIGKAMGKKDKKDDDEKGEEVSEGHGMHRDAKTGKVVDKAEVGKTYYPNQPKKKTSVTKKPDAFGGRFSKEEIEKINAIVETWEE